MFTTVGINPVRDSDEHIAAVVGEAAQTVAHQLATAAAAAPGGGPLVGEVHFYGAGCLPQFTAALRQRLQAAFATPAVEVASDLLGAARALLGRSEGIACILGTGSNSCLYDGCDIVDNVPALGWILGDEGSGAVLGRLLVGDVLKRRLEPQLAQEFMQRFALTQEAVIDAVYRQPMPNRFLASLVPFLAEHREAPNVRRLLVGAFSAFFERNVMAYGRTDLPAGFVGGVAYQFEDELREAAAAAGCRVGTVLRNPMEKMVAFHQL